MNNIKISAIIPCYNVSPFLERCLRSLLSQTFDPSGYEIILINDGSTDGTGAICDEYSQRYPFIKVVHKQNEGTSQARNDGIRQASGKYITFVDSDDWLEPECFETAYDTIEQYQAECVQFNCYIHQFGESDELMNGSETQIKVFEDAEIIKEFIFDRIGIGQERMYRWYRGEDTLSKKPGYIFGYLFLRSVIEESKLFFQPSMKLGEDGIFLIEFMMKCKKVVRIPDCFYHYELRRDGLFFTRMNNKKYIYTDKYCLLAQRERIRNIVINNMGIDVHPYYIGSHILSSFELCVKFGDALINYMFVHRYVCSDYVQESIRKIDVRHAPLKLKIPVLFLKLNLQFAFFMVIYILTKLRLTNKIKI